MSFSRAGEETKQLVYVAEEANYLFLSKAACKDLGILPEDFPDGGGRVSGCTAMEHEDNTGDPCDCPTRTQVPSTPELPFPVKETEQDRSRLEKNILDFYGKMLTLKTQRNSNNYMTRLDQKF